MAYSSIQKILFCSVFTFLVWVSLFGNGYNIKVNINGIQDTTIILGHYFNKSMYPDDTAYVDSKGKAAFKGKNSLVQGMYVIYLPDGKYFDLMMGETQNFTLETDTANFIKYAKISNSPDNEIFFGFQKYMIEKRAQLNKFQKINFFYYSIRNLGYHFPEIVHNFIFIQRRI